MTPASSKGRILIVEDDEAAAELARRSLHRGGWESALAGGVREASSALQQERFDGILLDYNLPDGEPWSLVELAHGRTPRIPVVLVTASGSEPIVAEALQRGVGDYIRKSERYHADLPRVIERVCGLARAEEALRRSGHLFRLIAEHGEDMILTLDQSGTIRYVSAASRGLLGHEMTDLVGMPIESLVHPDDDARLIFGLDAAGAGRSAHCEIYRLRHREGHFVWVEANLQHVPSQDPPGREIIAITRNITARIEAQHRVEAALVEKTVLLNEVHHRVKNNLQIIISLLKLQRDNSVAPAVSAALLESESRIRAMALIHQFLYEQKNFARLNLSAYLQQLARLVESAHRGNDRGIELHLRASSATVWLSFDQAVPCGLLVNELLTNAYKHAFPGQRRGAITLEVHVDDAAHLSLKIHDDGVGLPRGLNLHDPPSLGLQLAKVLVDQLGGRWRVDPAVQGTRFDVDFPTRQHPLRAVA